MKNFYLHYVILFIFVKKIYTEGEFSDPTTISITRNAREFNGKSSAFGQSEVKRNLNVILFIVDIPRNYTFNNKIKDIWNFDVAKTIQPCMSKIKSIKLKRISRMKKCNCECEIALKQHLLTLMDWARESIGMLTAVVSLTEHGYSDAISSETNKNGEHYGFNYFNFKLINSNENSTAERDDFIEFPLRSEKDIGDKNNDDDDDEEDDDDNRPDLVESDEDKEDSIPVYNAYPRGIQFNKNFRKRKSYFWSPYDAIKNSLKLMKENTIYNDDDDYNNKHQIKHKPLVRTFSSNARVKTNNDPNEMSYNRSENNEMLESNRNLGPAIMGMMNGRQNTLPPESNKENYGLKTSNGNDNDSTKMPLAVEEMSEKEEITTEPSNVQDLSNIMMSIKKQFFHNMMEEPETEEHLESFKQPTMKELIQITFNQTIGLTRGYLLLFMGRNVVDLEDPRSDFAEGLQYLIDNIKESNTVILISGGCIDIPQSAENEDMEMNKDTAKLIPFFALGPDANVDYSNVDDLCKISDSIKASINRHRMKEKEPAVNSYQ